MTNAPEPVCRAPAALRAALAGTGGRLGELLDEAVDHLQLLIDARPRSTVAAVAVPVAVHAALTPEPMSDGLLASAAATYLAFDVLDDQMDGDPPAFWRGRPSGEVILGSQVLLQVAAAEVDRGAPAPVADRLRAGYRSMIISVVEGQLRTEAPLAATTSPLEVDATVRARSGAMLAGFAELAAESAGGSPEIVAAARRFGLQLGVARQHVNDLTELAGERTTDLRNGTATMATALALQRLGEPARHGLIERLRKAATDPATRERVLREDLATAIVEVRTLIGWLLAEARTNGHFLQRTNMREDSGDLDRLIEFTATAVRSTHVP